MTASLEALCATLDEGTMLRLYLGPADFLCRVMAGDVLTKRDALEDQSPLVRTMIHSGIVLRARWMANSDG